LCDVGQNQLPVTNPGLGVFKAILLKWSEWEINSSIDLVSPIAGPELMAKYGAGPRIKAWLQKLGLPEYWRQVGWAPQCHPLSDNDFVCD